MEIITDIDKLSIISQEIDPVKEGEVCRDIILKMKNTLREHLDKTVGLAAIQIGIPRRIIVVNFKDGEADDLRTFINPMIIATKGYTITREACASIPGKQFLKVRFHNIGVAYVDPMGRPHTLKLSGTAAQVLQHEIDHLDGILLSDLGMEIDEEFDKASEKEKEEILKMYVESLDGVSKQLIENLEKDEEGKAILDTTREFTKNMEKMIDEDKKSSTVNDEEIIEKLKKRK